MTQRLFQLVAFIAWTVAGLGCSSSASADSESQGYRLAGILAVGHDYVAILELPDGGQMLVREGSELADGGGRVSRVGPDGLVLSLGSLELELSLDDSGRISALSTGLGVITEQSDQENVFVRQVDPHRLSDSLESSAKKLGSESPSRKGNALNAGTELAIRLAPILNLPRNSRVIAVNEEPVGSVDKALTLIDQQLAENTVVRLNLEAAGGDIETRVYIMAEQVPPVP